MSASTSPLAAVVARGADAERLVFPDGSTMTLLADGPATGGKLSLHHTVLRAGAEGANPHHHTAMAEVIYVLRGAVEVLVGDHIVVAGGGDLVVVPPGVAHAFAASKREDTELLVAVTPGIERFSLFRHFELVLAGREPAETLTDQSHYDTYPDVSALWEHARRGTHQHTGDRTMTTTTTTTTTTTGHRTMNTVIHAAFRRDLRRLADALEQFPIGDRHRADRLGVVWLNVAHQLHVHHHDEETLFWPAFQELGVEPSLIDELEAEHEKMVTALAAAELAMGAFQSGPNATSIAKARDAVAELHAVLDDHLTHEERDLEPFGAAHKDTPQHKAAVASARKSHTEGAGTFFAWLGDTDDPDIAAALRREVPAPVLFLLTKVGGRGYSRRSTAAWS